MTWPKERLGANLAMRAPVTIYSITISAFHAVTRAIVPGFHLQAVPPLTKARRGRHLPGRRGSPADCSAQYVIHNNSEVDFQLWRDES